MNTPPIGIAILVGLLFPSRRFWIGAILLSIGYAILIELL